MRKAAAERRDVLPDPVHGSKQITRCINIIMEQGKKGVAQGIVYGALAKVESKTGKPALDVYLKAIENVTPLLELKVRRVGGANYQVPVEVRPERSAALALRWLVTAARNRPEKAMVDRLANEVMDAANNTGSAVKKKEDTHKMAEANRAFTHMRY